VCAKFQIDESDRLVDIIGIKSMWRVPSCFADVYSPQSVGKDGRPSHNSCDPGNALKLTDMIAQRNLNNNLAQNEANSMHSFDAPLIKFLKHMQAHYRRSPKLSPKCAGGGKLTDLINLEMNMMTAERATPCAP
jgi:hypothetical protein